MKQLHSCSRTLVVSRHVLHPFDRGAFAVEQIFLDSEGDRVRGDRT